jgi:hypothetical protein
VEDSVEGRSQGLSVVAALPVWPKCKANVRFMDTFLDVHRNLVVHKEALPEPQARNRLALLFSRSIEAAFKASLRGDRR